MIEKIKLLIFVVGGVIYGYVEFEVDYLEGDVV